MDKMQGFFEKNWIWIITLIFSSGVNFATLNSRIETRVTQEEVRQIIEEELKSKSYTLIDGKVLEINMANVRDDLSEIKQRLDRLLQEKKK